jgi:predicted methyltransferase
MMMQQIVLSHFQTAPILQARRGSKTSVTVSPDLNLTTVEVAIGAEGVLFPGGERLTWEDAKKISRSENSCFVLKDTVLEKIRVFSEETNRLYSLMPTERAPTLLISGVPMHRIKDTDPHADTLNKIKTIAPIHGRALDTATGLGYTAIEAAKSAEQVITLERDVTVLEIARLNPWSRALFENARIAQMLGDSFEIVPTLERESFTRIVHDPPRFSLAGDLYSEEFYRQLYRVLKRGGRIFHYIGDLESKSGRNIARGVMERLGRAAFTRVIPQPAAFGVVAYK